MCGSRGEVECDEDGQGLFIFLRSWAAPAAAAALNTCDVILFFMTVHYQGRNREGRFFLRLIIGELRTMVLPPGMGFVTREMVVGGWLLET